MTLGTFTSRSTTFNARIVSFLTIIFVAKACMTARDDYRMILSAFTATPMLILSLV